MARFTATQFNDVSERMIDLWSGFASLDGQESLCPEEQIDMSFGVLGHLQRGPEESVEVTALLAEVDPSMDWLHDGWFNYNVDCWPPDGTSPEAWGARILAKCERWLDEPTSFPKVARPRVPPQVSGASRFVAVGSRDATTVANEATTRVLRAHREQLEYWVAHPEDGWDRLQLHADLAGDLGPIGTIVVNDAVRNPSTDVDSAPSPPAGPVKARPRTVSGVTGCTVIVRRRVWGTAGQDNLVIVDSYPEPPLEPSWRARYPDLVHAIGGYYHQTNTGNGIFTPQRQFHLDTTGPARDRVQEQLSDLLTQTDDQIVDALHAFGSVLIPTPPHAAREWLTRWHWRITGLPWNRRAANSWADRGSLDLK